MTRRVVAATRTATCATLARKMLSGFFSGVPVTDDNGKVIGVVTEFDLLNALKTDRSVLHAPVERVMTKDPICIAEDASIEDAITLMTDHHIIRLPVLRDGRLVGVISRCDILRAFVHDEIVTFQDGQIVE
jgi:CBS domain-containing protein